MKKLITAFIVAFFAVTLSAEIIFDGGKAAAWESKKFADKDGAVSGIAGYIPVMSKEFIQVPRGKKYTVSGEFKVVSDKNIPIYFGVTPFTAEGKVIPYTAVFTASRAIATLAKEVKAGDKSMILKGADSWKFHKHGYFVFNAKADRSDLPNLDLSPAPVIKEITVNEDGTVEIPFKKPFAKNYTAGTTVRQHVAGSSYIYAGNTNKKGEWVKFSKTFTSFYTGTAQIKVTFSVMASKANVELRNVKVDAE